MNPESLGLYGGIAGGVIGTLGGIAGTAVGLANTNGRRERAFVVRCAALLWKVMAISLTTGFVLPAPFGSLAMLPMFPTTPWLIRAMNRRQEDLRREEATGQDDGSTSSGS